jgi:hypothetical protein
VLDRKHLADPAHTSRTYGLRAVGADQERDQGFGERVSVQGLEQNVSAATWKQFLGDRPFECDNGCACGRRFERGQSETFTARNRYQRGRRPKQSLHALIRQESGKSDRRDSVSPFLEPSSIVSITNDDSLRTWNGGNDSRPGVNELVMTLVSLSASHPSEHQDDWRYLSSLVIVCVGAKPHDARFRQPRVRFAGFLDGEF